MRSPALDQLERLIGTWDLTMTNAFFLDSLDERVSGTASFEWLDDVLVVFRWGLGPTPPSVCVIGHSTPQEQYHMLYHDDRGVARVFAMEFTEDRWSLLREDSDFHQRFEAKLETNRIVGAWEASEDEGKTWRKDFDLIFDRVTEASK
ncbi:MAG TPA: hypothetical protein VF148_08685 [Acidimicrobiia bacterium]